MSLDITNLIAIRRERVLSSYREAELANEIAFLEGSHKATPQYIFENQKLDAHKVVQEFYENCRRIVSISKKTKIGMDRLMIEISKSMTTHSDDYFVVNPDNVRIITGMSNKMWETDMKNKTPSIFRDKIFHHGQLKKSNLSNLQNSLILIDEIDSGNKEDQVLHQTLREAGILNVENMIQNNNYIVVASATIIRELFDLYQWGDLHGHIKMTIPANYVGHIDFLRMEIAKEFYGMKTVDNAKKWIQEDIIDNYGIDFRVHIARVNDKTITNLRSACESKGVIFREHTIDERLTSEEETEFFINPIENHIILAVKGFFRRANFIPNVWKIRIGATHELFTKKIDMNVQIQGLLGRLTGYWKNVIESGHKTGPHRTSLDAIRNYELIFENPFGNHSYRTSTFTLSHGFIQRSDPTLLTPHNVEGLESIPLPQMINNPKTIPILYQSDKDEIESLISKSDRKQYFLQIIEEADPDTFEQIIGFHCAQITAPISENSYRKHITDLVNAFENNNTFCIDVKPEDRKRDLYMVFIDRREYRMGLMIYRGSILV